MNKEVMDENQNSGMVILSELDLSKQRKAEKLFRKQMEFSELLLTISKEFCNIEVEDFDKKTNETLRLIGEFDGDDRSYVFLFSSDGSTMNNTHEWCAQGIQPEIDNLQGLPVNIFPWWMQKLLSFENIYIPYVPDLSPEAQEEKKILQSQAIQSLVVVPIVYQNKLVGFLGFDSIKKRKTWSEESITLLGLVAQIIANALQHKQYVKALMKSKDYYRTIFENTGTATVILDEDLTISIINDKFEKLSGYSREELENKKKWWDFIIDKDKKVTEKYYRLRNTLPELAPREYETGFINRCGTVIYIYISVDMIPGTLKRVISIVDLTHQKQIKKELEASLDKMQRILNQTAASLATTVEIRDPYTAGHQRKVGRLASTIAREMNISEFEVEGIFVAGNLHDIGKIIVPSEILSKPTKLSEFEFAIMKTHCQAGYDIVKEIEFSWPVADILLQHHERIDGSGYPYGLSGEEILIGARILAVADVVEAIASHRPYRPALGIDAALEEISQNRGIRYDSQVVDACLKLFREKGFELK